MPFRKLMGRSFVAAIACVIALLAAPAGVLAHGWYDLYDPNASAPDGHYVLWIEWLVTVPPPGYAAGDMISFRCHWSDGSVDDCGELADWGF
jgi:hypothetical protein